MLLSAVPRVGSLFSTRAGVTRLGVVICVVLATAFSGAYFVKALVELGDVAAANAEQNLDDKEFGGGNALVVDQTALYEARALIPENGTYRVLTGPALDDESGLTRDHIEAYARYFLLPRRPAADARWVLCYGCRFRALGGGAETVWRSEAGVSLVRLPR